MEKEKVRKLISEGKTLDVFEYLSNHAKNFDNNFDNSITILKSRFNDNERDFLQGVITKENHLGSLNSIREAIVQLTDSYTKDSKELKRKILFLTANPKDSSELRLEEELRKVKDELSKTRERDSFQLVSESAVKVSTITLAMQEHNPEIVHFSGHGTGESGIVVENDSGNTELLPTEGLDRLFRLFKDTTKCVLLNACYSKDQAGIISKHNIYVIGMNKPIGDEAARAFAVGFYQSLGQGKQFKFAYEIAMVNIAPNWGDYSTPELWFNGKIIGS